MIAAIYARKSQDQHVADEEKSVTRQVERARAYAASKGWTLDEAHVYVDDGISGAEFSKRPGLVRLVSTLAQQAPFQVLVMMEEARLGREQIETAYVLKQLITAGVRVFFYLEDRERTLDSPTDKLMLSVAAFADEMEREKARQRTADAMVRKAEAGHVTGGRVFGYDNVEIRTPDGRRAHVERQVNAAEAAIVRRIFELSAAGLGLRAISLRLNTEHAPAPVPRRARRPAGWAPSSVREVLHRDLYVGRVVWNRTRKRDLWGRKRQQERSEAEWITREVPTLRIIPTELWAEVHRRLAGARQSYLRWTKGKLWGRPAAGIESKYLLTGFATCGVCGGSMYVHGRAHGHGERRRRAQFYGCFVHWGRGAAVCDNGLVVPMALADDGILTALEDQLLHPDVIAAAMRQTLAALQAPPDVEGRARLEQALADLEGQAGRLTQAVRLGGDLPTLVAELRAVERRRADMQSQLDGLVRVRQVSAADLARIESEILSRLGDWRGLLRRHAREARQMLGKLLVERVTFTPREDAGERFYDFEMRCAMDRVLRAGLRHPERWWPQRDSNPCFSLERAVS